MADKPESIYNPEASEPEKRKPGRPPNAKPAAVAEPAHEVAEALTVDHDLAPNAAPQEGETLEQAVARIGALRERNRKEWGEYSQKLALPKRAGYHTHWFNDVAGRLDEALASGWAHRINPRDGKPFHRVVGSGREGKPLEAYAMDLPLVFWQEEMDARHKVASDRIEGIKKNPFQAAPGQAKASDKGKFYDPTDGAAGPLQVFKG
jgi:hypothetical protein